MNLSPKTGVHFSGSCSTLVPSGTTAMIARALAFALAPLMTAGAAALTDRTTRDHVGNGFLFERGYSIVWSGWEADVAKSGWTMGAGLPLAMADDKPIVRRIREEMQVGKRVPADVDTFRLSYPAASAGQRTARLTMRARDTDPRVEIPADGWE